jgi:hypothetical protein
MNPSLVMEFVFEIRVDYTVHFFYIYMDPCIVV